MFSKKCKIYMLWLFYFIILHFISLKTVNSATFSNNLECYECYSHEKICDPPINPVFLPRTLCGRHLDGRSGSGSGYDDYDHSFLKRAFSTNITMLQQYREQQQNNIHQISNARDKRQIDTGYNREYSCLTIKISGRESGTIRGCAPDQTDICSLAKQYVPAPLRISSCETCKNDLCNSATAMSLSIFMIIISTILIIVLL